MKRGCRMKQYRIAAYIRLSMEDLDLDISKEKRESCSISNQRRLIRSFLRQSEEFWGADIREFADDGYSGTNFDRPAVQEMLGLCRRGEIDCIIVKDLSRFGRNYLEVGNYLEQVFPYLGIRFIGINDGYDSKAFCGKTGGMDVAFKNFIYEMYSKDLSGKVKGGILAGMKRGDYHSGCIIYGYQKAPDGNGMAVDEEAAITIRRIFQDMAEGKGARTVARELNAEGVPARLAYKQAKGQQLNRSHKAEGWNRNKIYSIVHNPVYTGDMAYRKAVRTKVGDSRKVIQPPEDWIVIPDHHEAIVSRDLFQKANEGIRRTKSAKRSRSNMVRGIVFCGYCKNRLELHKTKAPYYLCKRKVFFDGTACGDLRIEKKVIERVVWQIWKEHYRLFQNVAVVWLIDDEKHKRKRQEAVVQQKIKRSFMEKMSLYQDLRSGSITQEAFLKKKERLNQRAEALQQKEEEISRQVHTQEGRLERYLAVFDNMEKFDGTESVPRELMGGMVEKIVVYGDKRVEIVWRYGDGFETLDFL